MTLFPSKGDITPQCSCPLAPASFGSCPRASPGPSHGWPQPPGPRNFPLDSAEPRREAAEGQTQPVPARDPPPRDPESWHAPPRPPLSPPSRRALTAGSDPDLRGRSAIARRPLTPELPRRYLLGGAGRAGNLRGIWLKIQPPPTPLRACLLRRPDPVRTATATGSFALH